MDDIAFKVAWYGVFVFSVTLHEAAHAFTAKILGDPTAYEGGQVTIDPIPHMKRAPFGMIVLPIISVILYGWPIGFAHAPYDPYWAMTYPKRAAWMALAGPASNLVLAIIAGLLLIFGGQIGAFIPAFQGAHILAVSVDGSINGIAVILSMLFFMNVVLALFNIFPVPPLDGSGAVPLFLDNSSARWYLEFISQPTFGLIGIIVLWKVFHYVFIPVFSYCLSAVHALM